MRRIHIDADRHAALELPSGRPAASLRLEELRRELKRLGIDGVEASAGKSAILDRYLQQVQRVAEELRPPHVKPIIPLPVATMREAVAFIARRAA